MAVFSAAASIIGASKQAKAAKNAAEAQIIAAREAQGIANEESERAYGETGKFIRNNAVSQQQLINRGYVDQRDALQGGYQKARGNLSPYANAGQNALSAYNYELGLGERPSDYGGYQETDAYKFRQSEALDAVQASAAARGGLYSGGAMKAVLDRADGLASQEYDSHLGRLGGQVNMGMNAANSLSSLDYNFGIGNAGISRERAGLLSGNIASKTDALINRENNRSNIRTRAGTAAASTIGNALADRSIAIGNAWQQGAQGVADGINNAIGFAGFKGYI